MKVYVFLFALLCLWACNEPQKQIAANATADAAPTPQDQVKRGEYLVTISGCNDCHSPKKMGPRGPEIIPERMLSGYPDNQPVPKFDSKMTAQGFALFVPDLTAANGPWGTSFAANLTPDESGLANWTLAQFKTAMTQGKYKGLADGRPLLPPMPWVNYITMKEEDLAAIFAYLKSIPPVHNVVPSPIPPALAK